MWREQSNGCSFITSTSLIKRSRNNSAQVVSLPNEILVTLGLLIFAPKLLLRAGLFLFFGFVQAAPAQDSSAIANGSFQHPGMLNSLAEFNFIKGRLQAHAEPWQTAFSKLKASNFASLQWSPKPRRIIDVGFYNKPDVGGSDELNDSTATYVHALIWVFTGDERHAQKAIEILNAWSAVLETHTGNNAKLQAA